MAKLYKYVRNGPFKHPGAKSVKKIVDNKTTSLQHVDTSTISFTRRRYSKSASC